MRKGRQHAVVDTNVAITANRREGGSYVCANACAQELKALKERGTLVLDDQGLILAEYSKYLNYKGQPGFGDVFFRWVINNRGKADLCKEVTITAINHAWRQFDEFPEDVAMSDFDKSDQKFVAVAAAAGRGTSILQASDHKWLSWHHALRANGIPVKFLCEAELHATRDRKKSNSLDSMG